MSAISADHDQVIGQMIREGLNAHVLRYNHHGFQALKNTAGYLARDPMNNVVVLTGGFLAHDNVKLSGQDVVEGMHQISPNILTVVLTSTLSLNEQFLRAHHAAFVRKLPGSACDRPDLIISPQTIRHVLIKVSGFFAEAENQAGASLSKAANVLPEVIALSDVQSSRSSLTRPYQTARRLLRLLKPGPQFSPVPT